MEAEVATGPSVHRTSPAHRDAGWWARWSVESAVLLMATFAALLGIGLAWWNDEPRALLLWAPVFLLNGALTWSTASRLAPCEVHVGLDGVCVVTRGPFLLRRRRFIPFTRLSEVGVTRHGHLELRTHRLAAVVREPRDARELARRIVHARQAFRAREQTSVPEEVARDGRTLHRWCEELEHRVRCGDYRESPLSPDVLVRVAEDPGVDASTRAVAATVAARTGTDDERGRVRAAIETTVSPRLSQAFAHAAEGRLDARSVTKAELEERR